MNWLLSGFILVLTSTVCHASYISDLKACSDFKDGKKRLACYDIAVPVALAIDASVKENLKKLQEDASVNTQSELNEKKALAEKQPVLDIISAMKKMAARVEAGISYRDYSAPLGELTFAVNSYLQTPTAEKFPLATIYVNETLKHYKNAGGFWGVRFTEPDAKNGFVPSYAGTSFSNGYNLRNSSGSGYFIDEALATIWARASMSAAAAQNAFSQKPGAVGSIKPKVLASAPASVEDGAVVPINIEFSPPLKAGESVEVIVAGMNATKLDVLTGEVQSWVLGAAMPKSGSIIVGTSRGEFSEKPVMVKVSIAANITGNASLPLPNTNTATVKTENGETKIIFQDGALSRGKLFITGSSFQISITGTPYISAKPFFSFKSNMKNGDAVKLKFMD
jgi:hypothetical protein